MVAIKFRFSKTAQTVKEEAELKYKAQDFETALRFANKAKDLDPTLHGVQQDIAAYTVHYVAASSATSNKKKRKINDTGEINWYAILGISDDSVDTETIRKQYKKMALLVHPDKNNSIAAKGAFELVSDAWNMLSNESSRKAYDQRSDCGISKRRTTSTSVQNQKAAAASKAPPKRSSSSNNNVHQDSNGFGITPLPCPNCLISCGIKMSKGLTFIYYCYACRRYFKLSQHSSNCTSGATLHHQRSSPPAAAAAAAYCY